MKNLLIKELKFIGMALLGMFPMIVYLDIVLGVRLARDHGFWAICGFIACIIFYAELMKLVRD